MTSDADTVGNARLAIRVRLRGETNSQRAIERIQQRLQECGSTVVPDSVIVIPNSRADYEQPCVELQLEVHCAVPVQPSTSVDQLLGQSSFGGRPASQRHVAAASMLAGERLCRHWCSLSDAHEADAPVLEITSQHAYVNRCITEHPDVDCSAFCLGTATNGSELLVRAMVNANYAANQHEFKIGDTGRPFTVVAHFEHDMRRLTVYFTLPPAERSRPRDDEANLVMDRHYKLELAYSQIESVTLDPGSHSAPVPSDLPRDQFADASFSRMVVLLLKLRSPPLVWRASPRPLDQLNRRQMGRAGGVFQPSIGNYMYWDRVFSFDGCTHSQLAQSNVLALGMTVNRLLPYPLLDRGVAATRSDWEQWKRMVLIDHPCENWLTYYEIFGRLRARLRRSVYSAPVILTFEADIPAQQLSFPRFSTFRARYALQALLGRGLAYQVDQALFDAMQAAFNEQPRACEQALEQLLSAIDEGRDISLRHAFTRMYAYRCQQHNRRADGLSHDAVDSDLPKNCVRVRKVIVTPSRQLLLPAEVMMCNRVLREFGEENALRCVIRDDDGSKMTFSRFKRPAKRPNSDDYDENPLLRALVRSTLVNGVQAGGRTYEFLAWSNSQMRDHGCYLFAPVKKGVPREPRLSAAPAVMRVLQQSQQAVQSDAPGKVQWTKAGDIRKWMGDFSQAENLPKMMSRMGQCFTQAQHTIELKPDDWIQVDDVCGGINNQYTFSDGIGRLTESVANDIAQLLELDYVPSAFQVRFKGYKGMLTLDPYMPDDGVKVVFRQSQVKFNDPENNSRYLEIVKYSMPSTVYLNRPLINILDQVSGKQSSECHKRMRSAVLHSLERQLYTMADMLCNEQASADALAARVPVKMDFRMLREYGVEMTREPLFRSVLLAIHKYNIKQQLYKAKVEIPAADGRTMYGVMDETGVLQYGQVFVQYSPDVLRPHHAPTVYTGRVLMTKNPCLVPGDVRLFEAVDVAALHHLVDVCVFPQHGPRPHPDEMAGSDLDGDEYSVFFNPQMRFDYNEAPMDFPQLTADPLNAPPTVEDMADFFVTYLRQDAIGVLSAAHLRQSDRLGIFDELPNRIAAKCSVAVDFPKTGKPAAALEREEVQGKYPDFMLKQHRPSYRSERLVGTVYRKCRIVEDVLDIGQQSIDWSYVDEHLCPTQLELDALGSGEWRAMLQAAARQRDLYNAHIQSLLDAYGIPDEAAVVSGHIILDARHQLDEMEKENFSFYNTEKVVELRYVKIRDMFRKRFFHPGVEADYLTEQEGSGRKVIMTLPDALRFKALAWYAVCYDRRHNRGVTKRSFPWLVWDVIAYIKWIKHYSDLRDSHSTPARTQHEPIHRTLTQVLQQHCAHTMCEQYLRTRGVFDEAACVQRYCRAYPELTAVLYALCHWADQSNIFRRSALRPLHICLLLLKYAVGQLDPQAPYTVQPLQLSGALPDPAPLPANHTGALLLSCVKYLGSAGFCERDQLLFDDVGCCNVLLAAGEWLPLSSAAFGVYQHVALTASFTSLHLADGSSSSSSALDWDHQELDASVCVELTPGPIRAAPRPGQIGTHAEYVDVAKKLKEWSGCTDVTCRCPMPNQSEKYLFSASGSLQARQRLMAMLGSEDLVDCLHNDRMPDVEALHL